MTTPTEARAEPLSFGPKRLAGPGARIGRALLILVLVAALGAGGWYLWRERAASLRRAAYLHATLGLDRQGNGQLADAVAQFEEAVRLDPGNAHAWYLLGKAQREQSNPQGLTSLSRAVKHAPQNSLFLAEYGKALVDLGKVDEARSVLSQAIRLEPGDVQAHVALARAYLNRVGSPADLERAISSLRTALTLQPGDIQARFRLARALYQANRLEEARTEFQTTLTLLGQGARGSDEVLDGRTTWSATWLSLVKGCHYHLLQIAYRFGREDEAKRHRQVHEQMERYTREIYPLLGKVNADREDPEAQRRLAAALARFGLPAAVGGEAASRRWIRPWQNGSGARP